MQECWWRVIQRATITGDARKWADLPCFLLLFPSLPAVITTATCKQGKKTRRTQQTMICSRSTSFFQICFTADFFYFCLLLLYFRSLAARRDCWPLGFCPVCRRCCSVSAVVEGWPARAESAADRLNGTMRSGKIGLGSVGERQDSVKREGPWLSGKKKPKGKLGERGAAACVKKNGAAVSWRKEGGVAERARKWCRFEKRR